MENTGQPTNGRNKSAEWRNLTLDDIDSVISISYKVHVDLQESAEVFSERVKLCPEGCLALVDEESNELYGYTISHPIRLRTPPALDGLLGEIPSDANQFYIHDVAIVPEFRGSGYAKEGIKIMLKISERYASTGLVSVYGTTGFWAQFGFMPAEVSEELKKKLLEYGEDAVFLEREKQG
ncbi:hypothetical protein GQ44DRAFT_716287 [Phaeosphaeriaceae sp. PMI808]|nr:hypothetical protein GQ44DRAFT_716287 [Phaeosphaeriaceae sp. PMI808]